MTKHRSDSESESKKKKRRVVSQDQADASSATVRQILQEKKKKNVGESLPVSESIRREVSDDDDDDDDDEEVPSTQGAVIMDEEVPNLFTGVPCIIGKGLKKSLGDWKKKPKRCSRGYERV